MKNEFQVDTDISGLFKNKGSNVNDLLNLYKAADGFSNHALNNYYYDTQLLKLAANKYYTCGMLIERNYPKNNPQELIDYFCSLFNYCYFHANNFLSKYYTLPPFNYELALEYNLVAEKFIDIATKHEQGIFSSSIIKNYDEKTLFDYKHRKLVLQVDKMDYESARSTTNDDPKSGFRFLTNAVSEQKKVLEFAKENAERFDISLEEANLLSKEIKLEACRAEIIINRTKKGLESKKDSFEEVIQSYLNMVKLSAESYKTNPNSDKFRDSYINLKEQLKKLFEISKDYWFSYLIKFSGEKEIENLMKEIDIGKYKKEKERLEIKIEPAKRIILVGSFYLFMFLAILISIKLVADSNFPFYTFFFTILFAIVATVCLNAFILRSVDSLSEESLVRIIEIAFKFPIAGLKSFQSKGNKKEE